jgi:hypothetical protein
MSFDYLIATRRLFRSARVLAANYVFRCHSGDSGQQIADKLTLMTPPLLVFRSLFDTCHCLRYQHCGSVSDQRRELYSEYCNAFIHGAERLASIEPTVKLTVEV